MCDRCRERQTIQLSSQCMRCVDQRYRAHTAASLAVPRSSPDQGATLNSSNMPGIARNAHNQKKPYQPNCSTSQPAEAFTSVRGTAARLVNSANCVAVYARLVERAIKATKAAVPKPKPNASKPMTIAKLQKWVAPISV